MNNTYKFLVLIAILQTTACADLSYYLHSVKGQLSIMQKTRDIDVVLKNESIQNKLREQLLLVGKIRQFAFQQLQLPVSDSYTQYADLDRRYVLRNLFASAEFSISLQRWCYPIVGCAGYRGYFDDELLEKYKLELEQQGKDVYVANIPAYSTLGWFDDPVLNTFIYWPEYRLAGLIFHELAHQRLYIDGDSQFNESFATAVQQTAVEKWLQDSHQFERLRRYKLYLINRQSVVELIEAGRRQLKQLYVKQLDDAQKRQQKQQMLAQIKLDYQQLTSGFDVPDGFKYWFQGDLNNAKLASVSTYHANVQAFRNLLQSHDGDYDSFYSHVDNIADLIKTERLNCLQYWDKPDKFAGSCKAASE